MTIDTTDLIKALEERKRQLSKWTDKDRAKERIDEIDCIIDIDVPYLVKEESEKHVPNDPEEAAEKYAYKGIPDELKPYVKPIADEIIKNFIAGYNLCREQMLKEAVEKTVGQLERQWGGNIHFMHGFEVDEMDFPFLNSQECGYGDKVCVIVLPKED